MSAKAAKVDYSTYTHEMLFRELDSTSEKIANLQGKKAQIEQALRQKPEIPNDETAYDLKNPVSLPQYTSHEQLVKELQAEIRAEKCAK